MKILNLYACLGGNRYKWGDEHDITAVEWDEELARLYQERFPNDKVIVADAHQYLLDHYKEFDFIWSSPPCPTHSRLNFSFKGKRQKGDGSFKLKYPDMSLYQQIIFLDNFFDGKYVIENVIPYYEPLISAKKRGRHLYWTNFNLPNNLSGVKNPDFTRLNKDHLKVMSEYHDYDFSKYKGKQPRKKIANNLVYYEDGKIILDTVMGIKQNNNTNQLKIAI
jgi:DNA (cytosine-5)-methyltransferase 1